MMIASRGMLRSTSAGLVASLRAGFKAEETLFATAGISF